MQQNDPVHQDQGQWWFYDCTWTGRFGPYPDEATARGNLQQYAAWLETQMVESAQPAAEQPAEQQEKATEEPSEVAAAAQRYAELRDLKAEIAARHKAELAVVENELAMVDAALLGHLSNMGVDSVKAGNLTVFFQTELRAGIGDKGALMDFIRQSGQPELLQSRVSSTVLREYMEKNGGHTPPGVTAQFERVIRVRKN